MIIWEKGIGFGFVIVCKIFEDYGGGIELLDVFKDVLQDIGILVCFMLVVWLVDEGGFFEDENDVVIVYGV